MNGRLLEISSARLVTVLAFVGACAVFVGYMWLQAGGSILGYRDLGGYRFSAQVSDVDNLVDFSDVAIAGVLVGKINHIEHQTDGVRLDVVLNDDVPTLHQGVTVQVSEKSLAGQSYLRIVDGTGPELPDGTVLPPTASKPSVQLRDVLAGLTPPTRQALGAAVRSTGLVTAGRQGEVHATMDGLAQLGAGGYTALDALAAQGDDIRELGGELTTVLGALGGGQHDLETAVRGTGEIVSATAGQRAPLEESMRLLPGFLDQIHGSTPGFTRLAGALAPIARDLRTAAPDLNEALIQLPDITDDLHGLVGPLDDTLRRAPDTLDRVGPFAEDVRDLVPALRTVMQDVNPVLGYAHPYGRDMGAFIANFGNAFSTVGTDGRHRLRLSPVTSEFAVAGTGPVGLSSGLTSVFNPLPKANMGTDPGPFVGPYPRLERQPR
jgi:phospholipid/cholesterol/gamma-HCH transport system substrate-binding protein